MAGFFDLSASSWLPRLISRLSSQFGVAMAEGIHLFPFRTEKLSPPAPMVLPGRPGGRVGRRPIFLRNAPTPSRGVFASPSCPSRRRPRLPLQDRPRDQDPIPEPCPVRGTTPASGRTQGSNSALPGNSLLRRASVLGLTGLGVGGCRTLRGPAARGVLSLGMKPLRNPRTPETES